MRPKVIILALRVGVLLTALAFGLLLSEVLARLALNPADYLAVEMVGDPVLAARPSPSALARFDAWGFRNRDVPPTADIVAVGDSHTYGNGATSDAAWPSVVARLSGRRVYNMGIGGYGPNQYFALSTTKALTLHPRTLIWGLYMGDDFQSAYSLTYGLDTWADMRSEAPPAKTDV